MGDRFHISVEEDGPNELGSCGTGAIDFFFTHIIAARWKCVITFLINTHVMNLFYILLLPEVRQ